jgi:putative DNA primase/helicase
LLETTGLQYRELALRIESILGIQNDFVSTNYISRNRNSDKIHLKWINKWKKGVKLKDSLGEQYLINARSINVLPAGGVKFIEDEPYFGEDGNIISKHNALLAIASTTDTCKPAIAHLTYLGSDNNKLSGDHYPTPRKTHSMINGDETYKSIAVKLFDITGSESLIIGEGIETVLSGYELLGKKIPAWSCLNSTFLEKFQAPKGIKHLIILGDNDIHSATGHAASFLCAKKNLLNKQNSIKKVSVVFPIDPFNDFNALIACKERNENCLVTHHFLRK